MPLMPFTTARRRFVAAAAAAGATAALAPAGADAKIFELGATETKPKPVCPATEELECRVVTRTTAYQNRIDAERDAFVAPRDGRIAAWTIRLGDPTRRETEFFNGALGEEAKAGITVLRKVEKGSTLQEVVARSSIRSLSGYFGREVQFPLVETLPIQKGDRVALTVPSWAPVIAYAVNGKTNWRASRPKNGCEGPENLYRQTAMTDVGGQRRFQCLYTARLTYTATLISQPRKPRDKQDD